MSRTIKAAIALASTCLLIPAVAAAKTYEVTRTSDPAPGKCKLRDCSLREAVLAANDRPGPDRIVLPNRKRDYRLRIQNADAMTGEDAALEGDLDVLNGRLSVVHPRRGKATIDARGRDRVFETFGEADLRLDRLALTGGDNRDLDNDSGGAVQARGNLTIKGSVLRSNIAGNVGGAIDMEEDGNLRIIGSDLRGNEAENTSGAIRSGDGSIAIVRSRLIGNVADNDGGAIRLGSPGPVTVIRSTIARNRSGGDGGGFQSDSDEPVRIVRSTIADNRAEDDGGGVQVTDPATLTIKSSTISGNRAIGPDSDGGGVYLDGPTATIVNSTVSGNRANDLGGGIHAQDATELTLNAVTVVRNLAGADDPGPLLPLAGGGLYRLASAGFDVRNSLIALNEVGAGGLSRNDCYGDTDFDSLGGNLLSTAVDPANCEGFDAPTDLVRNNPKIGKLRRLGGPTRTVALKRGSAAIGHAHKPSAPGRDQRGRKRDGDPDTGAFERGA